MPPKTLIIECIKRINDYLEQETTPLTNRNLLKLCEPLGEIQKGTVNPHLPHEIAETAVNFIIQEKLARELLTSPDPQKAYVNVLKPLTQRLPTQTWRSLEQIKWQQFSTPTGLAYLLAYLLNLNADDEAIEPSSGTGSLAVWTSGLRIKTHTNEIDERRKILLECLGFEPTAYNAEFINDYLPSEIKPNCLIMNPPFSSNGGRTKNNSSEFGFRHVQSALERLKKDGKFGIILGNSAGLDTRTGEKFWHKLSGMIHIKAIIKIAGREYSKNGTRVDVNLIIGTKHQTNQETNWNESKNAITTVSIADIEEGFVAIRKLNLRLD